MRHIEAGEQERSIRADINWLCTSCDSCTALCPEGISIKDVTNALKRVSFTHGYADETIGPVEMIPLFYQTFWSNVTARGRLWPLSLATNFKFKSFDFFSDTGDGISMKSKGMLNLRPPAKSPARVELLKKLAEYEREKLEAEFTEAEKAAKKQEQPEEVAATEETTATEEAPAAEATTTTEEVPAAEATTTTEETPAPEVTTAATEETPAPEVTTAAEVTATTEAVVTTEEVAK